VADFVRQRLPSQRAVSTARFPQSLIAAASKGLAAQPSARSGGGSGGVLAAQAPDPRLSPNASLHALALQKAQIACPAEAERARPGALLNGHACLAASGPGGQPWRPSTSDSGVQASDASLPPASSGPVDAVEPKSIEGELTARLTLHSRSRGGTADRGALSGLLPCGRP
jgi:hypothetical protein